MYTARLRGRLLTSHCTTLGETSLDLIMLTLMPQVSQGYWSTFDAATSVGSSPNLKKQRAYI